MQVKISKTLEGIIARAAFNTTKAGIDHSLKDFLMLEMLREEGSLAYQLLSSRLKDWELYQVRLRIEREVLGAGRRENTGRRVLPRLYRRTVRRIGRRAERLYGPRTAGHRRRPLDRDIARTRNVRHHG